MVVEQTTKTLFLFIFLVALQYSPCITTTIAQNTSPSQLEQVRCNATDPPPSPIFLKFLASAINELKSGAQSKLHFKYYSTISDYTPIVHSSYLCKGDVPYKRCFNCVSRAAKTAKSNCSKWSTEAVVYEDECTFRYSDKSFYGRLDNSSSYVDPLYGPLPNKVNVKNFSEALPQAIEAIETILRSSPNYGPKVATEETDVQGTATKIYAMGECTWDLYQEDCRLCIHECASNVNLTAGKAGGRVMLPSCNFRYETYLFYDASQLPPSQSGGQPPPPSPPLNRKKKSHAKAIAAGTGGGAVGLVAIAGALTWAYQKKKTMQASADLPEDAELGPDSATEDLENPGLPTGEETGADLATDSQNKEGSNPINDEESESRKRKPAPKPSRGAKNNTAKKPNRR